MRYDKLPTMGQLSKAKRRLLQAVNREGFNSIEHFRDFYNMSVNYADVDIPLTRCFELALESNIEDEGERHDKANRLSDIIMNYYWNF